MSELYVIKQTKQPNTVESLTQNLKDLGVQSGDTLLVHASMKAIGWISGGPQAVLESLMNVVTNEGTLVFQTHSPNLSDPAEWENPPVPLEWHQTIRDTMPGFDSARTPSAFLGVLPELFRNWPQVYRSNHPSVSISAWGKGAEDFVKNHPLEYSLNEQSPLGRAYERNAHVLLLGVDYSTNTSFHLAEYWSETRKEITRGAPVLTDGKQQWVTYSDIEFNEDQFPAIGSAFEKKHTVRKAMIGQAESTLFSMKDAVDFAADWLVRNKEGEEKM